MSRDIKALREARDVARQKFIDCPASPYLRLECEKKNKALDKALFAELRQNKTTIGKPIHPQQQNLF